MRGCQPKRLADHFDVGLEYCKPLLEVAAQNHNHFTSTYLSSQLIAPVKRSHSCAVVSFAKMNFL